MPQEGNRTKVSSRSDAFGLVQWLAEFGQFVHECLECQQEIAPPWPLCTHCDIRLAISCPQCAAFTPGWCIYLSVLWLCYAPG